MKSKPLREVWLVLALLVLAGCQHIGPRTILDDRIPYNNAVATSWKQQTLLNIVRIRYMDTPEFVDVASIVNGYEHSRSASVGLGAALYPRNSVSSFLNPDLRTTQTMVDRPTITYSPQTGSEFTRNLTNPIPPTAILNLIESGYPADVVLELAVESINGIRNRGYVGALQEADPEFMRIVQIIKKAQLTGHVSMRVKPAQESGGPDVLLTIRDQEIPESLSEELRQLRGVLQLDPDVEEFKIVFGMLPHAKDEIAFRTRSVLRVLTFLALHVQVPEEHLADGRAPDLGEISTPADAQFTVYGGHEVPCDAFAAVQYQDRWFWIDQRDFKSKRTMTYLKVLLALADTKQKDVAPALTIRAN